MQIKVLICGIINKTLKIMKKVLAFISVMLFMSSCYNAKVCVGTMKSDDPSVKVNSVMNHHLLYGLIPVGNNKIEAKKYVGERSNYAVKNKWTFVDGLLGCITLGIYTPTTTTFYVPLNDVTKDK